MMAIVAATACVVVSHAEAQFQIPVNRFERWNDRYVEREGEAEQRRLNERLADDPSDAAVLYRLYLHERSRELLQRAVELEYTPAIVEAARVAARQQQADHARELAQRAIDQGDPRGHVILGELAEYGMLENSTLEAARDHYGRAHDQGIADGTFLLGRLYLIAGMAQGREEELIGQATALFDQAAANGVVDAEYFRAAMHIFGIAEDSELARGYQHMLAAAEAGHPDAAYQVGIAHHTGFGGIQQDHEEAVRWYEKAVEAGIADAAFNLALYRLGGIENSGIARDFERGLSLLHRAAENDRVEAAAMLAPLYMIGIGVEEDFEIASRYMQVVADRGDKPVEIRESRRRAMRNLLRYYDDDAHDLVE